MTSSSDFFELIDFFSEIGFKYSRFLNKLRMTAIKCKKSCEGTHCYWDRHPITDEDVIRCPTRYVPSEHKRTHVTRGGSSYVIKEKNNGKRQKKKNRALRYNDRSKRVLRDGRSILFSQMLRGVHTIERPRSHVR